MLRKQHQTMAEAKSPVSVTCVTSFRPKTSHIQWELMQCFSLCQQMPAKNYKFALAEPNIRQETEKKPASVGTMQLVWANGENL